jgi:hypothetical protein
VRRLLGNTDKSAVPSGSWEIVGSFGASQTDEYIFRAATVGDSTSTGVVFSVFVVAARTTNPAVWFVSAPDSGYSVDNIAPAAPQSITADYSTAGVDLDWTDATEPDFQYYRVYRGTETSFVPSPANLVQQTAVSAWTDPAFQPWGYFYKITAVDHAGNEGVAGSATSVSATGEGDVPNATALLDAAPNPFNPSTTLRFSLASAGRIRLTVHDVAGRRVATLVDDDRGPGRYAVVWEGRDDMGRPVASGVYHYRLECEGFSETKRMTLLK